MRRTAIGIAHRLFGQWRPSALSAPRRHPRILVMAFEKELGSAMAVTPLLAALRRALPDAVIALAGPAMMGAVAAHNPHLDHLHVLPNPHLTPIRALRVARRLRADDGGGFDWLITTVAAQRSRYALTAAMIPAQRRAGLGLGLALADYDGPVPYDPTLAVQANNLRALGALGVTVPGGEPEIYFPADTPDRVRDLLRGAGVDADRPIAVLAAQTSGGQPTDWFADRFACVADGLADRYGLLPVFIGTGDGAGLIDDIRTRMLRPAVSLAGRTDVAALAALLAGADLAIALDSGAMHVARATRVPMVVIASGWQDPHHWLPLGVETCHIVSGAGTWCQGCTRFSCPQRTCMTRITPEAVLAAAAGLLDRFPPAPAARAARIAACTGRTRP
ncbi:MAG: glycosyltransferase family 9 protein [Niveispirillum sp.]|uniref:glycosyltransferase family 9 protein n=1 Tax=Niveispirillum sp. TaxID=1917217 RepID=UPI003BA6D69C